jgi:hypothetical protein
MTIDQPDLDDLREVLDASFGEGPTLPTPAERLAVGRRAQRRRRAGAAGSVAAVLVVVAGAFAVLGPAGGGPQDADPVAPAPSIAPSTESSLDQTERQAELDRLARQARRQAERLRQAQLVSNQFPASLDLDGSLVVKDGWRVVRQVPEPIGYRPPEASLGVVVTDGSRTRWMLLTLDRVTDGQGNPIGDDVSPSASADDPGKGYSRFEDWLASMVDLNGGPATSPLVTVTEADEVVAGPDATLVEVRQSPVIADYTSEGDRLAQVTRDSRTWFVVVRGHGPDAEVIPVDADLLPERTFDAFVDHLSQQADSGEGVR